MSSSKRSINKKTSAKNTTTLIPSYDQPISYFPQRPTQLLPQSDSEFNPFDFLSQPEFVQQTQAQPQTVIYDSEPEFVKEPQPTRATTKRKEKT